MSRPDHDERSIGRSRYSVGDVPRVSVEQEPTSFTLEDLCVKSVGMVEPERRLIIDGEAPCDGERPDRVQGEPEEVVESEGHSAPVCYPWSTDLGVGEDVDRLDARSGAHHMQPQTGGVVWPTSGALRGVWWQLLAEPHRVLTGEVCGPPGNHFPIVSGIPFTDVLLCAMIARVVHSGHTCHVSSLSTQISE